jgi:hypothetical protein
MVVDPNPGFLLLEDGSYLLLEDGGKLILGEEITNNYTFDGTMDGGDISDFDAVYGEHVINRMTVYAYPRRLSASNEILFQLDKEVIVPPRTSYTLRGTYADPNGGLSITGQSMVAPVATTDYTMFSATGGGGSDITASLNVSITYGAEGFTAILTNTSTSLTGYVNKFNTRGIGIYKYNPIKDVAEDSDLIDDMGIEHEVLNQKYKTTLYSSSIFIKTVIEDYKNPVVVLNSITFFANKSSSNMLAFLYNDVGDMVYIDVPDIGIQGNHYIQGVEITINGGVAMCKWILIAALSLQMSCGLSPLTIEFRGGAFEDVINYGTLEYTGGLSAQSYSFWVYIDTFPGAADLDIIYYRYLYPTAVSISLYNSRMRMAYEFTTTAGVWESNANPFGVGAWHHIVVSYNSNGTTNDPIFYVDGSSITVNELQAPVGTAKILSGAITYIGNVINTTTGLFTYGLDGKIFDPRVYNRILSAAEVTTLYNGGTPDETLVTSGLVFQGFNVKTNELASYTDQTLTSALKIRDNAYGAIGTPAGSPIGRSAP